MWKVKEAGLFNLYKNILLSRLERYSRTFLVVYPPRPYSLSVRTDTSLPTTNSPALFASQNLNHMVSDQRVDTWLRNIPSRHGVRPIDSVTGILFVKYTLLNFHFPVVLFLFLKSFSYFCPGKGGEKGEASSFSGLTDSVSGICFLSCKDPFIHVTRATRHFLGRRVEISAQEVKADGCEQGAISWWGRFMRIRRRHSLCVEGEQQVQTWPINQCHVAKVRDPFPPD